MSSIFGGGEDGESGTTTTVNNPYPAAKPGLDLFYKNLIDAYKGGQLRQTPFTGQTVAPISPETAQSWQMISDRANAGAPLNAAASELVLSRLAPGYLTSDSPGLQSVIDRARQGVNAEFSRAGRTFSGAHAGGLAASEGQLRYQDLLRKAGEQTAAAQFAPTLEREGYFGAQQLAGVGQQRQAQLQDLINAQINLHNAQQAVPMTELGNFSQLLAGGGPGSTSVTGPKPPSGNPWAQGLGTALTFASLFAGG